MVKREEILSELNELIHDSPVRVPVEVMNGLRHALEYIENNPENAEKGNDK